jgi:hypothetical protein
MSKTIVGIHVWEGWSTRRHGRRAIQAALNHGRRTGRATTHIVVRSDRNRVIWEQDRLPTGIRAIPDFFSQCFVVLTARFPQEVNDSGQDTRGSENSGDNTTGNNAGARTTNRSCTIRWTGANRSSSIGCRLIGNGLNECEGGRRGRRGGSCGSTRRE